MSQFKYFTATVLDKSIYKSWFFGTSYKVVVKLQDCNPSIMEYPCDMEFYYQFNKGDSVRIKLYLHKDGKYYHFKE